MGDVITSTTATESMAATAISGFSDEFAREKR